MMKKTIILKGTLIFYFLFLLPSLLNSIDNKNHWKFDSNYDPNTEVTISGKILDVKEEIMDKNPLTRWTEIQIIIGKENEKFRIHLGPSKFLKTHSFEFFKGDEIQVTGSLLQSQNNSKEILARIVQKGEKILVLRNPQGHPEWPGYIKSGPFGF